MWGAASQLWSSLNACLLLSRRKPQRRADRVSVRKVGRVPRPSITRIGDGVMLALNFPQTGESRAARYARTVRLAAEILAARAVGRLSRLAGAGGGTTVPGKLLWKLDPGAIDPLAARLPQGSAVNSRT